MLEVPPETVGAAPPQTVWPLARTLNRLAFVVLATVNRLVVADVADGVSTPRKELGVVEPKPERPPAAKSSLTTLFDSRSSSVKL